MKPNKITIEQLNGLLPTTYKMTTPTDIEKKEQQLFLTDLY